MRLAIAIAIASAVGCLSLPACGKSEPKAAPATAVSGAREAGAPTASSSPSPSAPAPAGTPTPAPAPTPTPTPTPTPGVTFLEPHVKGYVAELAVSADGAHAIASLREGSLVDLDLTTTTARTRTTQPNVRAVALSRDGASVATVDIQGTLYVDGAPVTLPKMRVRADENRWEQDTGHAHGVVFASSGDLWVLATYAHYPMKHDVRLLRFSPAHKVLANIALKMTTLDGEACHLDLSRDESLLVASSCLQLNWVVRLRDKKLLRSDTTFGDCSSAAIAGESVSIGCVREYESHDEFKLMRDGETQGLLAKATCLLSPTGTVAACDDEETSRTLIMRDARTGTALKSLPMPDFITAFAFVPDGSRLLVGMQEGQVALVGVSH